MNYLQIVANHVISLDQVSSTNEYATQLIANSKPNDGTVITTSFQTAGKGQYGREWSASPGNSLLFSIILKPSFLPVDHIFYLNICFSLAVRKFIENITNADVKVKWPNDVLIGNNKCAGILIQNQLNSSRINHSIIGIGININQSSFDIEDATPTSIRMNTNQEYDLSILYDKLYPILNDYYFKLRTKKYSELKSEYLKYLYKYDEFIVFQLPDGALICGKIIDIGKNGSLAIESEGVISYFQMHEIKIVMT